MYIAEILVTIIRECRVYLFNQSRLNLSESNLQVDLKERSYFEKTALRAKRSSPAKSPLIIHFFISFVPTKETETKKSSQRVKITKISAIELKNSNSQAQTVNFSSRSHLKFLHVIFPMLILDSSIELFMFSRSQFQFET